MKKTVIIVLSFIVSTICTMTYIQRKTADRFSIVSEKSLDKTVSLYISGTTTATVLTIDENGFDIRTETVPVTYAGAGVFVSPNNHILTCDHLFHLIKITGITVCNDNDECTGGEVLYKEPKLDLAVVQANFDTPTSYIDITDPRSLKVGQEVIAIGNPLGMEFTVTHGIISRLNIDNVFVYNMTQSDTFLNPGNSGGPLIDLSGRLIGINSCIVPPIPENVFTGLGFSVSSGQLIEFLTRFRNKYEGIPRYKSYTLKGLFSGILRRK